MFRWLGGLLDRICAAACALLFAQMPLFMQQYTQQLIGREAELTLQVNAMKQAAEMSGRTLEAYIQKFIENSDLDFSHQGQLMQLMFSRWQSISEGLQALQQSNSWDKPLAFFTHVNEETFRSTFQNFNLGIPLNLEGGVYALTGLILGSVLFSGLRLILRKISRGFVKEADTSASAIEKDFKHPKFSK